jgi:hypothetical protein
LLVFSGDEVMATKVSEVVRAVAVAAVIAGGAGACAPLETGGGSAPTQERRATSIEGEVRSVDTRMGRLQVEERIGRTHTLRYDRSTQVVYRQRQYPVSSLERGDVVRVRVAYDRYGNAYADRVEVRQNVRDRAGAPGRVVRLDGVVTQVDPRRGRFTVQPRTGRAVLILMPARARPGDVRRFEGLRRGDRVAMEVQAQSNTQAVLVRFR